VFTVYHSANDSSVTAFKKRSKYRFHAITILLLYMYDVHKNS